MGWTRFRLALLGLGIGAMLASAGWAIADPADDPVRLDMVRLDQAED